MIILLTMRTAVVLPDPDKPMRTVMVPEGTTAEKSANATTPLYDFDALTNSITVCASRP
jgi:hypothetical protein